MPETFNELGLRYPDDDEVYYENEEARDDKFDEAGQVLEEGFGLVAHLLDDCLRWEKKFKDYPAQRERYEKVLEAEKTLNGILKSDPDAGGFGIDFGW